MYGAGNVEADEYENALKEEKHHKRMEELGGLGAAATGEFALVSYLYNIFILIFTSMRCISLMSFYHIRNETPLISYHKRVVNSE